MKTNHPDTSSTPYGTNSSEDKVKALCLTILCHPDLSRIGSRCVLEPDRHQVTLSRSEPSFQKPGERESRGLESSFVSRTGFLITKKSESEWILQKGICRSKLAINGQDLGGYCLLSAGDLRRGVTLDINQRVLLYIKSCNIPPQKLPPYFDFVGESDAILRARMDIDLLGSLEMPVLIRGESGTGKELAARAIHTRSSRGHKPLVGVNLGALPPNLAASELFGATRGAFTGATHTRTGFFGQAHRGTLFLDEIGEASAEVQASLLRALETHEIYPVGATKPLPVDVRLISATDASLEERCEQGTFRAPLFHRLSSYEVFMPTLRERREDLGLLFVLFAQQALQEMGESLASKSSPGETPWLGTKLMTALVQYAWPGNVRQFRNVVHQLVVGNRGRDRMALLPRIEAMMHSQHTLIADLEPTHRIKVRPQAKRGNPSEVSQEQLVAALEQHDWQPGPAARKLNISRPAVYQLIRTTPGLVIAEDLDSEEIEAAVDRHRGNLVLAAKALKVSETALRRRMGKLGIDRIRPEV